MPVGRLLLSLLALLAVAEVSAAAQPVPTPKPIYFASGSTKGWVGGQVRRGDVHLYSVKAVEGQVMTVSLTAPDGNAAFQIYPPDTAVARDEDGALSFKGKALHDGTSPGEDSTRWTGELAKDGIYLIVIASMRGSARYSMDVKLE